MVRASKHLLPVDVRIAELLNELVEQSGKSRRALASETGMSMNRLGIILRQEPPPATVGEIGLIARALDSTASAIIARAEGATVDTSNVVEVRFGVGGAVQDEPDMKQPPEGVLPTAARRGRRKADEAPFAE